MMRIEIDNTRKAAIVFFGFLVCASSVYAQSGATQASVMAEPLAAPASTASASTEADIRRLLESKLKGAKIESVRKSPFFGLYEARLGNELLYTDDKATYIIIGNVLDGGTLENLSKKRLNQLTAVKFEDLPLKDAIKVVNGTGKHQIAYFADPNCPYCKRFEQSLGELKDTTVYVFLYAILSPDSEVKAKALWCADDRAGAWTGWMRGGRMVATRVCDTPIDSNRTLGQRLNVQGTPTTFLSDGKRVIGTVPIAQIEKAIADSER